MQLDSWIATSFYPIIEKQCSIQATERLNCTYAWFDNNFGRFIDTDHDGYFESYYYETNNYYSNWVTSNILLSLLMGDNNYDTKEFLRNIYSTKFYEKFIDHEPEVLAVEYPFVRVSQAEFNPNTKSLLIHFNTEKPMILSTNFQIKYPYLVLKISNITRDDLSDGFTIQQISIDRINIEYSYNNIDKQQTQFIISFSSK
jgi:hypothetical protein